MRLFETVDTQETDRLLIRGITRADTPALFSVFSDPDVIEYAIGHPHTTETDTQYYIDSVLEAYTTGHALIMGISLKSSQTLIGIIGFELWFSAHNRAEIGYTLGKPYWGAGYATEALNALCRYGFGPLQLHRIEATTQPANEASWRVLEKAGFHRDGLLPDYILSRGLYRDTYLYSRLNTV